MYRNNPHLAWGKTNKTLGYVLKPSRSLILLLMAVVMLLGGPIGCKSKKKITETENKEETLAAANMQLAKAKAALQSILDAQYTSLAQVDAAEKELAAIKAMGITDPTIVAMIRQAEDKLAAERERLLALEKAKKEKESAAAYNAQLNGYFNDIANASSLNIANMKIDQAMEMFSSEDVPVLIIIVQENGQNDYDRPTTIRKYLNYLKDQKKNPNEVENVVFDSRGKIQELHLIKK
ncbi:MAG: hypothetical protein SF052_10840 [Bacteroidia bacterium]|nr:hypothetical protein [Bacteroidia bacterium]